MLTRRTAALAAIFSFLLPVFAFAHEYKLGDLVIGHPWARATPPGAPVAGGFAKITNTGASADRLVSVRFERAGHVEIHEMTMEGDVMKMAELPQGLPIAPGETVELKPGGLHLMFMDLAAPLMEGERIKGQLVFEKAGAVDVEFAVEAMGAKADEHGEHKHGTKDHTAMGSMAMSGNDPADIAAVMKSIFDKPENPLSVDPVVVSGDHAVAGWVQGETGGRALLRKKDGVWTIHLCSGDSLKDAGVLAQTGMPGETAQQLAQMLAAAEAALDPAIVAKFALFEGTVMVGEEAAGTDAHKHGTHGASGN